MRSLSLSPVPFTRRHDRDTSVILSFGKIFDWIARLFRGRKSAAGREAGATGPGRQYAGPARILLMRHAEKTGEKSDYHLSQEGRKRAEKLAEYIPATFGKPDFLLAAAPSDNSNRSIETLQPLEAATGVPLQSTYKDKQFGDLAGALLSDAIYAGKLIVICWHHGNLPSLAAALGAPKGSYPRDWDDEVFNLILDFSYRTDGGPLVRQVQEPF